MDNNVVNIHDQIRKAAEGEGVTTAAVAKSKVAILTNFMEFQPGYSLTGIVKDQARMLAEAGHEVLLFVNDQYHGETFSDDVTLKKVIPFSHLIDYRSKDDMTDEHISLVQATAKVLEAELADIPIVLTHDFIFTGWFLPYGLACAEAGKNLPNTRWLHWVHSVPSVPSADWWKIRDIWGAKHKIVYPNRADLIRVAEAYCGWPDDVRAIPHIKDLRTWFDFHPDSCAIVADYPQIMQADLVQVYPASVDRLDAKRVREVMLIFSRFKKQGFSVCLVLATQWATTPKEEATLAQYEKIARRNGLVVGEEVVFTAGWNNKKYAVGLPRQILRDLMTCSNIFIFPTKEETFGLVFPEAALTGGVYCVLNKSLSMMFDVGGMMPLYVDFGSFHQTFTMENESNYFDDVAKLILSRMGQNEAVMTKSYVRKRYNWTNLYRKFYGPVFAESKMWG